MTTIETRALPPHAVAVWDALTILSRRLDVIVPAEFPEAVNAKRTRTARALVAVADFMNTLSPDGPYGNLFANLATALEQLDHGILDPMLDHGSKGHKQEPSAIWRAKAVFAVAVEILRRGKVGAADANAAVIRYARKELKFDLDDLKTGKGDSASGMLISWRKKFRSGDAPEIAQAMFDEGCKTMLAAVTRENADRVMRAHLSRCQANGLLLLD
jgi:hypothetical protein